MGQCWLLSLCSVLPAATMGDLRMTTLAAAAAAALALVAVGVGCGAAIDGGSSTAPMELAEQEALYSVIQGFVGKWWDGRQLYPDPCGWTAIQGVGCDLIDGLWRVTSLSFGPVLDNSLSCSHSPEFSGDLFRLAHLRSLSFFRCFTSTATALPAAANWSALSPSLSTLELRSNSKLAGGLPSSLSLLTGLQSLVVTENSLAGPIPPEFAKLTRLRRLVLAGNGLSGSIPGLLFERMKELLILDLSRNTLTGSVPPSVGELSSLLKLDLSGNSLGGRLPDAFGGLKALTLLDLRGNKITGGLPNSLENAGSLQALLLSGNPLGGAISGFGWQKLKELSTLDLSRTGIGGRIPESVAELEELRFLALDNNRLEGGVPAGIAHLRNIGAMYLNGNNLTGALAFGPEFYGRLGRRFAVWGNPNLCYNSTGVVGGVPEGVSECRANDGGRGWAGNSSGSSIVGGGAGGSSSGCCGGELFLFWKMVVLVLFLDFEL